MMGLDDAGNANDLPQSGSVLMVFLFAQVLLAYERMEAHGFW
jgi:hypothetical protein